MDRSKRATYTPPIDSEASKRGTVSERSAGKAERARASTLLALGLAEEKEQALNEATLLSADVENTAAITAGNYTVQILGTDLAAKKAGKAYTVRPLRHFAVSSRSLFYGLLLQSMMRSIKLSSYTGYLSSEQANPTSKRHEKAGRTTESQDGRGTNQELDPLTHFPTSLLSIYRCTRWR